MKTQIKAGPETLRVDTLADRWIYDTENIVTASTEQQYFVTRTGKTIERANFEGDYSIVPEGHVFQLIAQLVCVLRNADAAANTRVTMTDAVELWEQGYMDFAIQGGITARENLRYVAGGFDFQAIYEPSNLGASDTVMCGTGDHANCRRYELEKIIPGGRSVDYYLRWNGGVTLGTTRATQVAFYGIQSVLL
mgnify:CR=1 FL=1